MNIIGNRKIIYTLLLLIYCNACNYSGEKTVTSNASSKEDSICRNDTLHPTNPASVRGKFDSQKALIPLLDTIVYVNLSRAFFSDCSVKPPLSLSKSKMLLYDYYQKKDFYINGKVPPMAVYQNLPEKNRDGDFRYDVYFDTAWLLNLNNDGYTDAIIEYELLPPYGCGHCLGEPYKALIISEKNAMHLTGFGFIPEHFHIDSIQQIGSNSIRLYGFDNDCIDGRIIRNFKIEIKTE